MSYRAPVSDMLATMRHVAGLDRLIADGLAPELEGGVTEGVLGEAAKFAADVIAPLNRVGDAYGSKLKDGAVTTPPGWKEAYKAWAEAGWNALPAPEAYGGQGLPSLLQSACIEMWNSAAFAFAIGPLPTIPRTMLMPSPAKITLRTRSGCAMVRNAAMRAPME
jgi:hypothetical protein